MTDSSDAGEEYPARTLHEYDSVYSHLVNRGPATLQDLPRKPTQSEKEDGVRRFKLSNSVTGSTQAPGGRTKPVYYIRPRHSPKSVLETWRDANPSAIESLSRWSIHQRVANQEGWTEASAEVFGPFHHSRATGGPKEKGGDCPLCDEEYSGDLRNHLPCGGGDADD